MWPTRISEVRAAQLALAVVMAVTTLGATVLIATEPSTPTGLDCQARLSDPAPLSTPDREWLDRCVSAFTLPTTQPVPSPTLTTVPPSPSTSTPPPTTSPAAWPNPSNTGIPAGWQPTSTRTTDLVVTQAGAVVENIRLVNASISVRAANVTIRRVEILGGGIWTTCAGPLLVEDVSILRSPDQPTTLSDPLALGPGSYTARRLLVDGIPEGLRVGERDHCGPAIVLDSFVRVAAPDQCGDWHGDGLQGYQGAGVTVRHSTFVMTALKPAPCEGTSPVFWPNQGNGPATFEDVLAIGGRWYAFRMGTPGSVRNLLLVGERDVTSCSQLTVWQARRATVSPAFQPIPGVAVACG